MFNKKGRKGETEIRYEIKKEEYIYNQIREVPENSLQT